MSLPHESRFDDRQLERYVLGLLSEGDRERLDEASIVDDEVALRLRVVEQDLADSYVRGQLTGDTLSRFESHYLASPLRRENVRLAEKLASAIARIAPVELAPLPQQVKSEPRLARGLAAVAALVLAASAPLLIELIGARLVHRPPAARVKRDRPARELISQRGDATFAHALLAEPDATILYAQTSAMAPITGIAVPPGAGHVAFELRLESSFFPRYRVGLRDPLLDEIVWRSEWILTRPSAGPPSLPVVVPTRVLKTQHYALDLTGSELSGDSDAAGSYLFRVLSR
jgi:hypothetical protein